MLSCFSDRGPNVRPRQRQRQIPWVVKMGWLMYRLPPSVDCPSNEKCECSSLQKGRQKQASHTAWQYSTPGASIVTWNLKNGRFYLQQRVMPILISKKKKVSPTRWVKTQFPQAADKSAWCDSEGRAESAKLQLQIHMSVHVPWVAPDNELRKQ